MVPVKPGQKVQQAPGDVVQYEMAWAVWDTPLGIEPRGADVIVTADHPALTVTMVGHSGMHRVTAVTVTGLIVGNYKLTRSVVSRDREVRHQSFMVMVRA